MLIATTPNFQIERLYAENSLRNYTYLLIELSSRRGWVIDPWDGEETWQWAQTHQVKLSGILNTHQHHDHIRGNAQLVAQGVPVLARFEEVAPGVGEKQTWAAPGHTMEHQVYWLKDGSEEHFFAGDTLFQAGVGNCKNGGEPGVLFTTIQSLKQRLSPRTILHPGHDYLQRNLEFAHQVDPQNEAVVTQLAEIAGQDTPHLPPRPWSKELQVNPFLRTDSPDLRKSLATNTGDDEIIFKTLRKLRDNW